MVVSYVSLFAGDNPTRHPVCSQASCCAFGNHRREPYVSCCAAGNLHARSNVTTYVAAQVVINNAGVASWEGLSQVTAEAMLRCFTTNAIGPLLTTQQLMKAGLLGRGSVVANMTSKVCCLSFLPAPSLRSLGGGGSFLHRLVQVVNDIKMISPLEMSFVVQMGRPRCSSTMSELHVHPLDISFLSRPCLRSHLSDNILFGISYWPAGWAAVWPNIPYLRLIGPQCTHPHWSCVSYCWTYWTAFRAVTEENVSHH
jgi:hypothetical protein